MRRTIVIHFFDGSSEWLSVDDIGNGNHCRIIDGLLIIQPMKPDVHYGNFPSRAYPLVNVKYYEMGL